MKKSFTLIEVLISITLLSIITIFLYNTLDLSQKSNKFYSNKLDKYSKKSNIKKLFYEDILNCNKKNIKIYEDRNKNSIISFKTSNTFHNPFYNNVTYILSKEKELLRIQSMNIYNKKKLIKFKYEDNKYIDIVQNNIKIFKVILNNGKIIFFIKDNKEEKRYISIKL
jgi:prepilin-type N-terminal cleavage/methylation domain-containing protein